MAIQATCWITAWELNRNMGINNGELKRPQVILRPGNSLNAISTVPANMAAIEAPNAAAWPIMSGSHVSSSQTPSPARSNF